MPGMYNVPGLLSFENKKKKTESDKYSQANYHFKCKA